MSAEIAVAVSRQRTLAISLIALGALLRIGLLNVNDYRPKADEGYYRRYAAELARKPVGALGSLVDSYLGNEKWHNFPSPLRVGHIVLSGAWMRLHGREDFAILSCLSTYCAIATLLLGYAFTLRLFGPGEGLATLALLAASPLQLALGRRALQDAVVEFFILSSLVAFHQMLCRPARAWRLVFSLAFFTAILCKESSVLLLAFFVPWLVIAKGRLDWRISLIALAAPLLLAGTCWLWICGGPAKFLRLCEIVVLGPRGNPYVLKYQSGSIARYLYDFLLASPLVLCLAPAALFGARRRTESLFLAAFFAAEYLAFSCFAKNLRYVLALDYPIRALAVLSLWRLTPRASLRAAAVAGLVIADLFFFQKLFLDGKIYDPVTVDLEDAWTDVLALKL